MTTIRTLKAHKQRQRTRATVSLITVAVVAFIIGLIIVLTFDLQLTTTLFEDGSFVGRISGCLPWELCAIN